MTLSRVSCRKRLFHSHERLCDLCILSNVALIVWIHARLQRSSPVVNSLVMERQEEMMTRSVLKPCRSSDSADVRPWGRVSLLFSQADDHLTWSVVQRARLRQPATQHVTIPSCWCNVMWFGVNTSMQQEVIRPRLFLTEIKPRLLHWDWMISRPRLLCGYTQQHQGKEQIFSLFFFFSLKATPKTQNLKWSFVDLIVVLFFLTSVPGTVFILSRCFIGEVLLFGLNQFLHNWTIQKSDKPMVEEGIWS